LLGNRFFYLVSGHQAGGDKNIAYTRRSRSLGIFAGNNHDGFLRTRNLGLLNGDFAATG
jgi:hypothetical protein